MSAGHVVLLALLLTAAVSCKERRATAGTGAGRESGDAGELRDSSESGDAEAPKARTVSTFDTFRRRANVPAIALAAVTRDTEVVLEAIGKADFERNVDATVDTPFEAASIAKTMVATCAMQLVEERRADLDADVSTYVGFEVRKAGTGSRGNTRPHATRRGATNGETTTLRRLLSHTAGIEDRIAELEATDVPLGDFLRRYFLEHDLPMGGPLDAGRAMPAPAAALDARPIEPAYSNAGVALAAFAVEKIAGESFAKRSTASVFNPLRMTRTAWSARELELAGERVAVPHRLQTGNAFAALPRISRAVYPVVGLHATVRDLARFARAILRGGELDGRRVLSAEGVATMLRRETEGQALAWQIRTIGGRRVTGHEGEDRGASTALFLDVEAGVGAIVLANGDAFGSGQAERARAISDLVGELLARAAARAGSAGE